ncbi:uncharacterized protein LOC134228511 [Saccostrea cucullata]|uniref:uncharacterized protein LOC134228511 n=1 Tax=Saccostrea cuccullata TaxID=36930 RepID=UPI002ED0C7CA
MAEDSCNKHLDEEISLSDGNLTAGFDGAWQKRGTGCAYNSLTGHASLIGEKTKKCIGISVMGKRCRICESAEMKGVPPRKHNCPRNWSGSAKSMEPAMACEMLQGIIDQGHSVQTLVMDNDSTTIARVRATVDPTITKKSDSNHTRKGFMGSLVELGNTYKVLKNNRVRSHIERCFMYCVKQNSGNSTKLAEDLKNIVPHLYGEHDECGTWCRSQKTNYKPKNLPYGKPLSDQPLRVALESLINKYIQKADELVDLGSTQNNENFNHMVASKAPKRLFYGGSESLKTRVSATVCQKNEGYNYITELRKLLQFEFILLVNVSLIVYLVNLGCKFDRLACFINYSMCCEFQLNRRCQLSPGRFTEKLTSKLARKLKRQRLAQAQKSVKRRRLQLKNERTSKDATQSVLEGATYSSKIGLEESVDLEDISMEPKSVCLEGSSFIVFDLETTGLDRSSEILQIACVCGTEKFNVYMKPRCCSISISASDATGLTYVGGILKHNGKAVQSTSASEGLQDFLRFLSRFPDSILIGHNIQNFDLPVLLHQLTKYNLMKDFEGTVSGYIDTLKLSRKVIPKADVGNYRQQNLVQKLLGETYEAHDAIADVSSLQKLFDLKLKSHCDSDDIFHLSYYSCKESLDPLVKAKVISSVTLKKLISLSLTMTKLQVIHKRDPQNGIHNVFSENLPNSKKPRVSRSKAVIGKVVQYLSNL